MSERVWEQTGPGSACRSRVCQLVFIPPSLSLLSPFETQTSSTFLSWAAQLFCRRWIVAWFIRGYVYICNTVCCAAHVWTVGGGLSSGTVHRNSCDEICSLVLGFLLLYSAADKRLPTTTFSSFLVFFLFLLWSSLIFCPLPSEDLPAVWCFRVWQDPWPSLKWTENRKQKRNEWLMGSPLTFLLGLFSGPTSARALNGFKLFYSCYLYWSVLFPAFCFFLFFFSFF